MTSYIKFTPLSGALNEGGLCYLLEIDNAKILLDCGWLDSFDLQDLESLKRVAPRVDAVLLSHADIRHLGAYPYALAHLGLNCPVYATLPVQYMGRLELRDAFQSRRQEEDFKLFTIDDIEHAFNRMTTLKHSQPVQLSGKCAGITVVAYMAGHTIGGALWKIHKNTEEIVYAVDYNHKKERHLNGTVLHANGVVLEALMRPSILITDAFNALSVQPPRKQRDLALFETINTTIEAGGNVLIPIDASLRILELAYLLDQHWSTQKIKAPLLLLGHTSYYAIQYAKSMTEWMGGNAAKQFHQSREHPFDFRAIRLIHNKEELDKFTGPKVVLATCASMITGYSRQLWLEWALQPNNTVILTERGDPDSITRNLHDAWMKYYANIKDNTVHPATGLDITMDVTVKTKIPLEGEELRLYLEEERTQREREAHEAAVIARSRNVLDEGGIASDSSGSEDEEDVDDVMDTDFDHLTPREGDISAGGAGASAGGSGRHRSVRDAERHQAMLDTEHDLYVRDGVRSGGFFKQTQSFPMFPFTERRRRFDDYGETIQQDHYMQDIEKLEQAAGRTMKDQPNFGAHGGILATAEKKTEAPCKYLIDTRSINVQCNVQFIDFEGLADGRSIKTILPQVAPRKLIVVHGTKEATEDLARTCLATERMTHDVFAPTIGETLNVSAATNMYQVKLTDTLIDNLEFKKKDDCQVAYLMARVQFTLDSTTPTLQAIPMEQQRQYTRAATLIGDAKLTELKRALQQQPGMQAEFRGDGVLVCNNRVAIRKTATGQLVLEGAFSSDYYKLRRLLYDQLAIV